MAPRIKILIIIGVGIYIALSLYHWRQVKNLPVKKQLNGVANVLKGDNHEKNWVQITTDPATPSKNEKTVSPAPSQLSAQKDQIASMHEKEPLPDTSDSQTSTSEGPIYQELQTALQNQRDLNLQQAKKIKEQFGQILSLQADLDETKEQETAIGAHDEKAATTNAEEKKINSLSRLLQTKIEALQEANRRISELADRLDQARLSLVDAENNNTFLNTALTDAEAKKIEAEKKAEAYLAELHQIKNEKEKYLSETGRIYTELQQTRTRLSYFENELKKMQQRAAAMYRFGQEQNELITPFRQQIEILNGQIGDKNRELLEAEDVSNELSDQNNRLQDTVANLRNEMQSRDDTIAELKKDGQALTLAQENSAKLTQQLQALVSQLNERDQKITNMQSELTELRSKVHESQQQLDLVQKEKEELEQALAKATGDLASANGKLNATETENKKILGQLTALQQELKRIRTASVSKQQKQTSSKPEEMGKEADDKNKALQLAQAEKQIKELQLDLQNAKKLSAKDSQEISTLKHALAEAQQKLQDTQQTDTLQAEIKRLRATVTEKEKQHKEIQQRIQDLAAKNTSLQERLQAAQADKEQQALLEKNVADLSEQLAEEQKSSSALEQKSVELEDDLKRREKEFFALQDEFSDLQNRLDTMRKERDNLILYTIDRDNDTIADAIDNCPETIAGAQVGQNGCELDADGDTIVDRLDLCPDSQENSAINVFGCTPGAPIVLSGLYFSGGNTELSPASKTYLDSITPALLNAKNFRFEVSGHTDSIGEDERNQKVSQLRAEAVSNYLVSQGINEERLKPVGYGSAQPIAENSTPEGRAANRRVELKILSSVDQRSITETLLPMAVGEEEGSQARSGNRAAPQTD